MRKGAVAFAALLACAASLVAQKPHVVMISLDSMKPEYVTHAKEHNLHLLVLERFLTDGTYAEGVVGVIPTVTIRATAPWSPASGRHNMPSTPISRSTLWNQQGSVIDMRQIAPSVARMLNVKLPGAKLKPVHYEP